MLFGLVGRGHAAWCTLSLAGVSAWGLTASPVLAEQVSFAGYQVEVDAQAGSGANASVLVIDWDTFGGPYNSPSHAFLYLWDGDATVLDMLTAFQDAGVFSFTGTSFLSDIAYTDADGDSHSNPTAGNWELASGTNPQGVWEGFDTSNPDWDFNLVGVDQEFLIDGHFEGINAAFFDPNNGYARVGSPLSVPLVPEPGTLGLVVLSGLMLGRRRRRG